MQFMVVVERGKSSYGAYVPDLPGCVAVARTRKEVLKLIREAVELHLESIRQEGLDIPEPGSTIEYVHVLLLIGRLLIVSQTGRDHERVSKRQVNGTLVKKAKLSRVDELRAEYKRSDFGEDCSREGCATDRSID